MMYYGNSTLGFDEPDTPMVFLQCGFCPIQMGYAGTVTGSTHTLGTDEHLECDCGATYGEGDTLEVVPETNYRDHDYAPSEEYYQEFYSDADLPF
jgi:hypothetical protein